MPFLNLGKKSVHKSTVLCNLGHVLCNQHHLFHEATTLKMKGTRAW